MDQKHATFSVRDTPGLRADRLPLLILVLAAVVVVTASCKSCDDPPPTKKLLDASPPAPSATPSSSTSSSATPVVLLDASGSPPDEDAASTTTAIEGDGGVSLCRLAYGPAEQPFRGPATLVVHQQELRQITNDNGKPRVFPVAITASPKGTPSVVPPRPSQFMGMRWPPCEVAGPRFIYCQGPGSQVLRSTMNADGTTIAATKNIGKARSSTRLAAAPIGAGNDHSVVAFLDVRRTTEGDMLQAFVALDENQPVRLSEDGAGATTVRFLQRGDTPVALYLDTRTAMVPVHARAMSLKNGGELNLANDAVLFVGGAPERGIDFTVSMAGPTKSYAFIPMPRDTMDFGMATLPIDDPPKDNIEAVWSKYPNGIDPAPIAAASAKDGSGAWIARVRPRSKEVGSPRIIELGKVDAKTGAFTGLGEIASGKSVTDVAMVDDGTGVWVLYGDTTVTWLERRICGK